MRRIDGGDPYRLIFRQPCGWGGLVTLPIFLALAGAGLYFGCLLLGAEPPATGWGPVVVLGVALYVGYKFVSGGVEWLERYGVVLDLRAGTVTAQWGLLVPLSWRTERLDDLRAVALGVVTTVYYRNGNESGRSHVYTLDLVLSSGELVRVGKSWDDSARLLAVAEDVGRFLGLPVADATGDAVKILPPDTVGRSLHERVAIDGLPYLPPAPLHPEAEYRRAGRGLTVTCPWVRSTGCFAVWVLLLVGLVSLLSYIFADSKGNWSAVGFFGAVGGFVLALLYSAVAPSQVELEADPAGLTVRQRGQFATSRKYLPAHTIREVGDSLLGIRIRTDDEEMVLPTAVPGHERNYLLAVLIRVLTGHGEADAADEAEGRFGSCPDGLNSHVRRR